MNAFIDSTNISKLSGVQTFSSNEHCNVINFRKEQPVFPEANRANAQCHMAVYEVKTDHRAAACTLIAVIQKFL